MLEYQSISRCPGLERYFSRGDSWRRQLAIAAILFVVAARPPSGRELELETKSTVPRRRAAT